MTGSSRALYGVSYLRDLPAPVEVRLGARTVTVEEIEAFQSGTVLPLDTRVGGALQLYVGNVHFAMVELVLNDGRVRVRVLEVIQTGRPGTADNPLGPTEQRHES